MYGYEIFHEKLMESILSSVHSGTCSHAYIFEGAYGLGTLEAAKLFAAALTCQNQQIAPCGSCPSCVEAKADTNPDIVYVRPEADRKSIGANVMRNLENDVSIKPFAAARKVYIFEDGRLLTEQAQNVFLKTFEEPPEYAVFIIVTENADLLLQTIRSRSVTVHFPNVSDNAVRRYISDKYPDEGERLEFLVKYCAGIPKTADNVIADENFETLRNASLEKLPLLFSKNPLSVFELQQFTADNKDDFAVIADFWLSFMRDMLLIQTGSDGNIMNVDKRKPLGNFSARAGARETVKMMDRLVTAQKMSARYVNVKAITYWLGLT